MVEQLLNSLYTSEPSGCGRAHFGMDSRCLGGCGIEPCGSQKHDSQYLRKRRTNVWRGAKPLMSNAEEARLLWTVVPLKNIFENWKPRNMILNT